MQSDCQTGDNNDSEIDVDHPIYQSLDEDRRPTAAKLLRLANDSFLSDTSTLHGGEGVGSSLLYLVYAKHSSPYTFSFWKDFNEALAFYHLVYQSFPIYNRIAVGVSSDNLCSQGPPQAQVSGYDGHNILQYQYMEREWEIERAEVPQGQYTKPKPLAQMVAGTSQTRC
ncbi:hypothetical protein B9Z19DRAFT_1065440 [Tuber borchii]|uniref:Uncharacterized protein n=1 Tax=Tuber borchii TaxID=42251 RepID=A0A2T6ZR14_TUBBO|nr:hypothetical protein B9Z19DRAFT_1065440 [Tuber borchii]